MKSAVLCLCFLFFGLLAVSALPYNNRGYRAPRRTPYRYPTQNYPYRRYRDTPVDAPVDEFNPNLVPEEQQQPQPFEPLPLDIPLEENPVIPEQITETPIAPVDIQPEAEAEPEPAIVADATNNVKPNKVPKRKQKPQVEDDEDDDDDQSFFPFASRSGSRGSNVFFPIMFGGYQGRSSGGPGVATAIANSFSTGRKGTARSEATAFGNPDLEAYLKKAGGQ